MISRSTLLALRDAVNTTGTLTATAALDFLGDTAPAATVQTLPGARWATEYADGSGIHEQPFAVLTLVAAGDTSARANASAGLYALASALEAASPISGLGHIRGTDTPALIARGDDGSETWRATFVLESEVQNG